MFHDGGYMVGMHAWWWLFWVILIGVLFASSFLKLRGGSARRQHAGRESPGAVLQRRLAAGEITPQQYEERRALLDRDAHQRDGA
jgi:putative membrane protein